jgi:asparagine synthase (glutamine-hydrolysing)
MFRELGYDNFSCFTYGTPHLWEVKCAREIARTAEAKWHFIPYDPKQIKKLFCSQDRKRYFHFASGLSSLPSISDYFALKFLCEDSLVSRNSIIINGQSGDFLTGGHIPKILEKYVGPTVDLEFLIKLIIDKHYSLWENLKTPSNLAVVKERIREILLPVVNSVMTPGEASQAYELQEWQERQCKYVVNGQRIYDWLGFDWRLPLWCDELIDFWRNVPWQTKCAQRLYKKYLMRFNPGGLFTLDIKVNQNDCPFCLKIPNRAYNLLAKAFNLDGAFFYRTFVKYYGAYSPFYPQKKYLEYLKDSRHHRNHISYLSKTFLDELCASNIGETEKHR